MDYIYKSFGKHAKRRYYSNKDINLENLNLLDIQNGKFEYLIKKHLHEIFKAHCNFEIYEKIGKNVINDEDKNIFAKIIYKNFKIKKPRRTQKEAISYNKNFEAPVYLVVDFIDMRTGLQLLNHEVYLFDLPLITDDGSFIINGIFKVIVPQLVRSNGIYFREFLNYETQRKTYKLTILPAFGLWLIFEFLVQSKINREDEKSLFLKINQNTKVNFIYFLKSMGFTNELLFNIFGDEKWLKNAIFSDYVGITHDTKYLEVFVKEIKLLASEKNIHFKKDALKKIEILKIFNNNLYIYVPLNNELDNFIDENLATIQKNINEKTDNYYDIYVVNYKLGYIKNYELSSFDRFLNSKRIRHFNVKNELILIEGFTTKIINKLFNKGVFNISDEEINNFKNDKKIIKKIIDILEKFVIITEFNMKIFKSIIIKFKNLNVEMKNYVNNDFINNFLTKDEYLQNENQFKNFDYYESIKIFYSILKPGDPIPEYGADNYIKNLFFDESKYNISKSGLQSIKSKLNIIHCLPRKILAQNIVDNKNKILIPKNTLINHDVLLEIEKYQKKGYLVKKYHLFNQDIVIDQVAVYRDDINSDIINIIGVESSEIKNLSLSPAYIIVGLNYLIHINDNFGAIDDIDGLDNRRIKSIDEIFGDLIKSSLLKIRKNIYELYIREFSGGSNIKLESVIKKLISSKNLSSYIREFVNTSQLSQFLDQTNPLSNISNKRKITALGPGGLNKERAGLDVRDVHTTHFGRICPIETPEGPNIGLISNLSCYSKVDDAGFLLTPYHPVDHGKIDFSTTTYLSVIDEKDKCIAEATVKSHNNELVDEWIFTRVNGKPTMSHKNDIDYICIASNQIISVATALIPFLENDDSNRTLMGANMQRQALPLLFSESPIVGTGLEHEVAVHSKLGLNTKCEGKVVFVDSTKIVIEDNKKKKVTHNLIKFKSTNQNTCFNQQPIVNINDKVQENELIADGPSMKNGELSLGKNVLVAFTTFYGYNFEDAIVISERLAKDDVYTSLSIDEFKVDVVRTKLGNEELTVDIPNVSEQAKKYLNEDGIVKVGTIVNEGDILVGKITPKANVKQHAEFELLNQIFGEKAKNVKNSSLILPSGSSGIVLGYRIIDGDDISENLGNNVLKVVKIWIGKKRKIQQGDKLAGRHGNKGVISVVLPVEDMPYLEDGTPIDVVLNPLGVPSRMNIGQILELQLGYALEKINDKIMCPSFQGLSFEEIAKVSKEANLNEEGKITLYNGISGEPFAEKIAVGSMYILKLDHMIDDKIHVRSTGSYSLITQQPLGGKTQNGGQRFGEMEVWALEGYGASNLLQEMLTIKSDDIYGRIKTYENIIRGHEPEQPHMPASIKVLFNEMRALGLYVDIVYYGENNSSGE